MAWMRVLFVLPWFAISNVWAAQPAVLVNSAHAAQQMIADFIILHPELNTTAGLSLFD